MLLSHRQLVYICCLIPARVLYAVVMVQPSTARTSSYPERTVQIEDRPWKLRAKSVPINALRKQSSTRTSDKRSAVTDTQSIKSCYSALDLRSIGEQNRERLLDAFLPDIRQIHSRMGYEYRVRPFNLNQEKLKSVQIRAKTAWDYRYLREHPDQTLGHGGKAATSITPRPAWVVKELPVNSMNDNLFPEEGPTMCAYIKRPLWYYKDRRYMQRATPKRSHNK